MMALLMPLYISILDEPSTLSKQHKDIHDYFLQRVMQIGPKHPESFRSVMQASPSLKQKLEAAVRVSQATTKTRAGTETTRGRSVQQQPSIKLKMDFSNFK